VLCFLFSWNEFLFALIVTRFEARTARWDHEFHGYEGSSGGAWPRLGDHPDSRLLFAVVVRRYLVRGLLAVR